MAPYQVSHHQNWNTGATPGSLQLVCLEEYIRGCLAELGRKDVAEESLAELVEWASAAVGTLLSEDNSHGSWLYLRVSLPASAMDSFVATQLAPFLLQISSNPSIQGWWWLFKHDTCGSAMRLRIRAKEGVHLDANKMVQMCSEHLGCHVTGLRYEPELRLFGGLAGMRMAHDQFMNESRFLVEWITENGSRSPLIPHGLSLALILKLLRASGLDSFECWDVFDKLSAKRPALKRHQSLIENFRGFVGKILYCSPEEVVHLYGRANSQLLERYLDYLDSFGKTLSRCYYQGDLVCGLREILVPIILFHWNRIGLSGLEQLAIAHSAAAELGVFNRRGNSPAAAVRA